MTTDERMQRESSLIATIRRKLPDFAKACADDAVLVLLHQDAFAADYQCSLLALVARSGLLLAHVFLWRIAGLNTLSLVVFCVSQAMHFLG
jgi:hypothetical protein